MSTESNRSFTFASVDIKDMPALGQRLNQPQDEVSKYLNAGFSGDTLQSLSSWLAQHSDGDRPMADVVVQEFNGVIQGPLIYQEQRFARVTLSNSARVLHSRLRVQQARTEEYAHHLNQILIKDAYPVEIWRIWVSDIEALKNPEDEDAWKEAYEILWPVANHAARKGSNLGEAEIQEIASAAILAIRKLLIKNLKPITSGRVLIGMTARRSRWNTLNRLGKWDPLKYGEEINIPAEDEKGKTRQRPDESIIAPDEHLCRVEDIEYLRRALTRLDERQRALLMAREIDGKSYEELQKQFNLSSDQVGVYLKRAREKLKTLFEEERERPL